jgi:excisionase family DNA binding protein
MGVEPRELDKLPALIGVEQACSLLGISRSTGYRAVTTGDLPTIRLGRRVYVPTARLCEMVGLTWRTAS